MRRRTRTVLAAALGLVLMGVGLVACAPAKPGPSAAPTTNSTVTLAEVNPVTSLNANTPQGNGDTNGIVSYLTVPQFHTLGADYSVVPNRDLGSYVKVSDDPLTVRYTLGKGVRWSDGAPMTSADLLLGWAEASGYFDSATLDASGKVTSGVQYFTTAQGHLFSTNLPTLGSDGRSITFSYAQPYADWRLVSPIDQPAHVVAKAAGVSEAQLESALRSTPKGDPSAPAPVNPVLRKAADFVNTAYDGASLPSNKALLVSGGPMKVSAWNSTSITLVRNPLYTGAHAVRFGTLVIRFIGDSSQQVSELSGGDADIIQPQLSGDVVKALAGVKDIKRVTGSSTLYDHVDLNFGSSVFSDPTVRKAFLLAVPRDQILKQIVAPVDPKATVPGSLVFRPTDPGYAAAVKQNGSAAFASADPEQAKTLLAGRQPVVKILYNTNNPNIEQAFTAIQAAADKVGFQVIDGGSPDWESQLPGGDYDASIFGWRPPGAGTALIPQLFQIGNPSNYNRFDDQQASDLAMQTQSTLDPTALQGLKVQIDTIAYGQGYGLPLFQVPGLFASGPRVAGVKWFGGSAGVVWNVWDWRVTS